MPNHHSLTSPRARDDFLRGLLRGVGPDQRVGPVLPGALWAERDQDLAARRDPGPPRLARADSGRHARGPSRRANRVSVGDAAERGGRGRDPVHDQLRVLLPWRSCSASPAPRSRWAPGSCRGGRRRRVRAARSASYGLGNIGQSLVVFGGPVLAAHVGWPSVFNTTAGLASGHSPSGCSRATRR